MNIGFIYRTIVPGLLLSSWAMAQSLYSTGELSGLGWQELERYVSPQLIYTHDYISNTGGNKAGPRNLGALEIFIESDLSNYSAIPGQFLIHYAHLDTADGRGEIGDGQVASNIDTGAHIDRIVDLWYQHKWNNKFYALIGFHDLSSEFNVTESSLLFLNSSFGTNAEIAYAGNNGPSLFPLTTLGVRALYHFTPFLSLRSGIYDSDPGGADTYKSFHSDIGNHKGYMHITELAHQKKEHHKVGLGLWYQTRTPGYGGYAIFERKLNHVLSVFGRYGLANPKVNIIQSNLAAGLAYQGIFRRKKNHDEIGLGATTVNFSRHHSVSSSETAYELNYHFKPASSISLRPDVQYIDRPSGNSSVKNAWAIGVRTVVEL